MANRPKKYDANLPHNLTYRNARRSFYWRNPHTGEELGLGRISRKDAISQAIQANNFIESNIAPVALLERLVSVKKQSMSGLLAEFEIEIAKRTTSKNTLKARKLQIKYLTNYFGSYDITEVNTKLVAEFLKTYIDQGKNAMAIGLRSLLSDFIDNAISNGIISSNPVTPTKVPDNKVKRERLILSEFQKIHSTAQNLPSWMQLSFELALISGQRREDICILKKTDARDERLWVIQGKTGNLVSIPFSLRMSAIGKTVGEVVKRCLEESNSEFLISSSSKKTGRQPGALHPDSLTKAFVSARKLSGLTFTSTPPTFHEIRSLSGRLYEDEYGKEFAQKLLGHKSIKMTDHYLDRRQKEWIMV
ncbi:tyrosine-type recombinase/integrase [Serratia sp. BW106]|uniref:tyrosine-type recombinase/integrase n=1 Tax=Serratia sp. BW106 TaxID=1884636 RepID=UPI000BFFC86C|nr:tyrosine-type recombinase/integrase [Serratia sp. BW106]